MPADPSPATIYVIDDEECVRRSMGRLFRSSGFECRCYSSVDEFLAAKCQSQRACVVSDLRMPGHGALELSSRLREAGRSMPVIILTAYDTPENREAARQGGAVGYFRKPVDDQALLDAIEWAMSGTSQNLGSSACARQPAEPGTTKPHESSKST